MNQKSQNQEQTLRAIANDEHEISVEHEIEQVTTFVDESGKETSVIKNQYPTPTLENTFPDQQLYDFLERPRVVKSFSWTPSQKAGTLIQRIYFPDALFESQVLWSKLKFYLFFRAGIKIQIKTNGTAFHYGQLCVAWKPCALGRYIPINGTTLPTCYDSIVQASQFPHVLVSPMSSQNVEMRLPYQSPLSRIPLAAFSEVLADDRIYSNLGVLDVYVMTPLRTEGKTTDTPVNVTIFAMFTDPDLIGATHQPQEYVSITPPSLPEVPYPSGLRYTLDELDIVTKPLDLPYHAQSEVTNTTAVGYFPVQLAPGQTSFPTALLQVDDNIGHLNSGSTLLSDHLEDWSYLISYNIPTTATINTKICSIPIDPTQLNVTEYKTKSLKLYTKLAYLSELFMFWSGPIEFRLDFVASRFHSARFRVAWYPPDTVALAPLPDLGDALSKIIDVQGDTSEVIEVPYLLPTPYLSPAISNNTPLRFNGQLVVTLLNPITYPGPNGPPITVNIWIRAPNIKLSGFLGGQKRLQLLNGESPQSKDPEPWFAQAECDVALKPDLLNVLSRKPTLMCQMRPQSKIWITPPMCETMPAATFTGSKVIRANTLLDYLLAIHLGYRGSVQFQALNPVSEILVVPRVARGFVGNLSTERKTTLVNDCLSDTVVFNSHNYFPPSPQSLKQFRLPGYTSMEYRPMSLYQHRVTTFPILNPGIDIYQYSNNSSLITLSASDDFCFIGKIAAPFCLNS